jgi:hypothetical protein
MQAHIDYEHNAIMLNKMGATLTMFDHVLMKSEAAPSSGDGNSQSFMAQFRAAQLPDKKRHALIPLTETDDTQCRKADALFTSGLSTDYLNLIPDFHHMFVGLTQTEATHIVTMATAEIHPIDFEAGQQQPEATVFSATDETRPSSDGGNNDVVSQHQGTVNKDHVSDKKRKAVEAIPPTPAAQRTRGDGQPSGAMDPAIIDHGKPPPASDRIEGWLDNDAAADQGFIRTGRKMYRPPLPSHYTGPEVEDDLLDGHDWVYKEHGKALRHTKEPFPRVTTSFSSLTNQNTRPNWTIIYE